MKFLLIVLAVVMVTVNAGTVASCGSQQAVLEAHDEDFLPFSQLQAPNSCRIPSGPFCDFDCNINGQIFHYKLELIAPTSFVSQNSDSYSQNAQNIYKLCRNGFGGCDCRMLA
jgi:hypothetical protein